MHHETQSHDCNIHITGIGFTLQCFVSMMNISLLRANNCEEFAYMTAVIAWHVCPYICDEAAPYEYFVLP